MLCQSRFVKIYFFLFSFCLILIIAFQNCSDFNSKKGINFDLNDENNDEAEIDQEEDVDGSSNYLAESTSKNCNSLDIPSESNTIILKPTSADDTSNIQDAIKKASSRDIILLEDGIYNVSGIINVNKSYITIKSKTGNRENVIIDGNYQGYIFQVTAPNVTIADMTIKRSKYHLVHVKYHATNAILHNLYLEDARQQFIKINPDDTTVYPDYGRVSCSHFQMTEEGKKQVDPWGSGCYTGGIDGIAVSDWHIYDNYFNNIYCPGKGLPTHMILFWRNSRNITVERNEIVNCARGIGFALTGSNSDRTKRIYSDNSNYGFDSLAEHYGGIIKNNMIYSNIGGECDTGISVYDAIDVKIYNNTVYVPQAFSSIEVRFDGTKNVKITNNLYFPDMQDRIKSFDNNMYEFSNNVKAESSMFFDVTKGNLYINPLSSSSISKIIGKALFLEEVIYDFDGRKRDSSIEIGADDI